MNKGQISFAFAGILFGFLVGFVVAHQIYAGRGPGAAAQMGAPASPMPPAPGRPGMGQAAGGGASLPEGHPPIDGSSGEGGGAPDMAQMEAVQKEIGALKALLEKEPRNLQALTRLGDMYFDAGMFDKASDFYARSLDVNPSDVNVRTDLGTALRNLGQHEEAMKRFEESVAADPAHWKGWFNIGIVSLYDLGEYDRAREAFKKVESIKPGTVNLDALDSEIEQIRSQKKAGGGSS